MSRRPRRSRRLVPVVAMLLCVVFIAAGCSSSGHPESYDDQIDEDTGLSNVEMNWLEGCEVGFGEELADEANTVCACSYERIKAEIPFEDFIEVNDRLSSNPESLVTEQARTGSTEATLVNIVRDCIATS